MALVVTAISKMFEIFNFILFSSIILTTPNAALRKANGSLEPVGFSCIPQKQSNVSILSARATAIATELLGTLSLGPCGLY